MPWTSQTDHIKNDWSAKQLDTRFAGLCTGSSVANHFYHATKRCSPIIVGGNVASLPEHRPELPEDFEVRVDQLNEEGRATYLAGIFRLKGIEFSFEAIAMEGYGGPNIAAKLPDSTLASLRELGLSSEDIDDVIVVIQRKIMEGGAEFNVRREPQPEKR